MHTCSNLLFLRRFMEAVIQYTGARKIDVIAHSVGVVMARKALKGGSLIGTDGNCTLGPPLTAKVDTFVGIAGPNYGETAFKQLLRAPKRLTTLPVSWVQYR
ncbi:triacylglycerol lipase [Cooperia oncophora]